MLVTVTLKNRLYVTPRISLAFTRISNMYSRACSYGSKIYFDYDFNHNKSMSMTKLHANIYRHIRRMFKLKAQEADSVPRTIKARYRSVNTQMERKSVNYPDKNRYFDEYYWKYDEGTNQSKCHRKRFYKWYHCFKNVKWLWHPIHFHSPQVDLVYKNDWSILSKQNRLSINTLDKRAKVKYYLPNCFRKYLRMPHRLGTAKLIKRQGHWYLYVSCTVTVPDIKKFIELNGSDRGLRFINYTYDGHHSTQIRGLAIRKKRNHFLKQRKILQYKGTRSARRKLSNISGRENCWMSTTNHRISKALVLKFPSGTHYYLENLRGVRFAAENASKKTKYGRVSWPFYQFGTDLNYKALLNGSKVDHVNPQYTSQRCPECGRVVKNNRDHNKHLYHCSYCDYTSNDDRIGAMNIRFLGKLNDGGYLNPVIKKDNSISYSKYIIKRIKRAGKISEKKIKKRFVLGRTKCLSHVTNRD